MTSFAEAAELWVKLNVGNPRAWFADPMIKIVGAVAVEDVDVPQLRDQLNDWYADARVRLAAYEVLIGILASAGREIAREVMFIRPLTPYHPPFLLPVAEDEDEPLPAVPEKPKPWGEPPRLPTPPPWAEWAAYKFGQGWPHKRTAEALGRVEASVASAVSKFIAATHPQLLTVSPWMGGAPYLPQYGDDRRKLAKQYFDNMRRRPQKPPQANATNAERGRRNRRIIGARAIGETNKQIAEAHGLSTTRVSQIIDAAARQAELTRQRWRNYQRARLARIEDPDPGQRDVWLVFTVPADPRFDAMEPVG